MFVYKLYNMKEFRFTVRDKSLQIFFGAFVIGYKKDESRMVSADDNAYYLLKDEIYLKKESGLEVGDLVKFELIDTTRFSQKEITNNYIYAVCLYDDFSIKLVLTSFFITNG